MTTCGRLSIGVRISGAKSLSDPGSDLQAGDVVWVDLDPRTGREQSGRRPVLIVSEPLLWQASRLAIVCPITSRIRPFASSVVLPAGSPIAGEIMTSHVRSIDTIARPTTPAIMRVPDEVLAEVRAKLAVLLGLS